MSQDASAQTTLSLCLCSRNSEPQLKKQIQVHLLFLAQLTSVTFDLQLNCENRKLKYLSLSSRPCLDELLPSISDCIALETDADADADAADGGADTFTQYQQQVKGTTRRGVTVSVNSLHFPVFTSVLSSELRETVNGLLEEKKNFVCQIHDQQRRIEELTVQVRRGEDGHSPVQSRAQSTPVTLTAVEKFCKQRKDLSPSVSDCVESSLSQTKIRRR